MLNKTVKAERKGIFINFLNDEKARIFTSIDKAKKFSHQYQIQQDGALRLGCLVKTTA